MRHCLPPDGAWVVGGTILTDYGFGSSLLWSKVLFSYFLEVSVDGHRDGRGDSLLWMMRLRGGHSVMHMSNWTSL